MAKQLAGKRALVTGAASGMGQAIAVALASEGARVAVHARGVARAKETVRAVAKAGGDGFAVAADLVDPAAIKAMCREAIKRLGGIDIVVNNAGVADYAPIVDMKEAMWDWIMDTNLKAPFLVCKHTLPTMIAQKRGGTIIFNASTNGKTADAEWTAYNASKHAVIGVMRCLAAEVGVRGIRVNALCPGWIETKMAVDVFKKLAKGQKRPFAQVYDEGMRFNMMKALIPPQSVADAAVFLASDKGRHVTGQAINICAGLCYW